MSVTWGECDKESAVRESLFQRVRNAPRLLSGVSSTGLIPPRIDGDLGRLGSICDPEGFLLDQGLEEVSFSTEFGAFRASTVRGIGVMRLADGRTLDELSKGGIVAALEYQTVGTLLDEVVKYLRRTKFGNRTLPAVEVYLVAKDQNCLSGIEREDISWTMTLERG